MSKVLGYCFNGIYLLYLMPVMVLCVALFPVIALYLRICHGGKLDDVIRRYNHLFGNLMTRASWPLVRLRCTGTEDLHQETSCVVVVNHRSTSDVMFASFFTPFNTTVFVRSWPFKILFLGWFMRSAGYVDTEKVSIETFLESEGRLLKERNVSFLFFPEGHRSANGKLQNFHSGAFHVAAGLDIPIIPVSLTGTEKFVSMKDHFVRPATVGINILSPVHPTLFEGDRRAWKLKKYVEDLVREDLNEQA